MGRRKSCRLAVIFMKGIQDPSFYIYFIHNLALNGGEQFQPVFLGLWPFQKKGKNDFI